MLCCRKGNKQKQSVIELGIQDMYVVIFQNIERQFKYLLVVSFITKYIQDIAVSPVSFQNHKPDSRS